jgi:hypothetical protein
MSTFSSPQRDELDRLQWAALGVGTVAILACVIGALFNPAQFFRAYLSAYQFYLGIALGSLTILMVYHLTGGAWGFLLRRFLEAAIRTLPLLAVLFIPIAYGVGYLYPWTRPEMVAQSEQMKGTHIYLNMPFFWGRAAFYFIVWVVHAFLLSSWSRRQDQTGDPSLARRFRLLSGPGLVLYGITITFASIDWVMSLEPPFHSTIFGPLYASGQFVSGQAFAVLSLALLAKRPPLDRVISLEVLIDLGNLLLTFLVIWTYMVFFQFMLIWIANLREEVVWYLPRISDGWEWVAWALIVLHFAVPFFLLLMRDIKGNPPTLAAVAGLILFMQLVYGYYQIMPSFGPTHISEHWMDFLTPLGIGGIWLAYFLWQLKQYPLLPRHDLNQEEAAHLHRRDREEATREEMIHHG